MATLKQKRAKVGRPTGYTPELLIEARAYFDDMYKTHKKGEKYVYPSIAELALTLGITRETVYQWAKDEKKLEFSDIVSKILTLQELSLHDNGLFNRFNPTITKLLLSKHGYRDRVDQDITSNGQSINPVLVKFINDKNDRDTQ